MDPVHPSLPTPPNDTPSLPTPPNDTPSLPTPPNDTPSLLARSNDKPLNDKPSLLARSNDKPSNDKPSLLARSNDKPSNDKLSNDKPSNDKPSNDKPSNDKPSNDKPSLPARSNYKPSNDTLSLPAPSNDTPSLPATSNDKRSSPANNEVLFAISPIDRPPLTTMQNRNLIQNGVKNVDHLRDFSLDIEDFTEKYNHVMTSFDGVNENGAESRDKDENEDDAPELVYPPEDGVLPRSDDVSNDKIPQYAAEHSVDVEPQWLQEMREKSKKMLAKYDDKINEMDKKLKKMMAYRQQMAQDFDTKINQLILKWISNQNGTTRYRHLRKRDKANGTGHKKCSSCTPTVGLKYSHGITPVQSDMPPWMICLYKNFSETTLAFNIKLFIMRFITHTNTIFEPYARYGLTPILHMCNQMLEKSTEAKPSEFDTIAVQRLLENLFLNYSHKNSLVMQSYLDLIKKLIESSKERISAPTLIIHKLISDLGIKSKQYAIGLSLIGILLANHILPYNQSIK
ncbi:unnamed protein product [Rotaria magnacalcarata]|uniref:Uncharacterized protein n=3 Tax=Rotaria magnacalcarata TaxID=392030 RepID=A0A816VMT4_9BILA|nr:unnamed protein product [Rotaria magnacalcarata]